MGLFDQISRVVSGDDGSGQLRDLTQTAPTDAVAGGLADTFKSDQTPAIGEMAAQLFGHSDGAQKAGMLNQLIAAIGPTVMAGLGGGILGNVMRPGQSQITADQAQQLSPQQVKDVVNHANEVHPAVADRLGEFYAQHKGLINTLGGIAAAVALTKMKERMTQR